MGEMKEVLLKELIEDESLAKRMDTWYKSGEIRVYQCDDKLILKDAKGVKQGSYSLEELIEEFEFESANSKVPRKCVN